MSKPEINPNAPEIITCICGTPFHEFKEFSKIFLIASCDVCGADHFTPSCSSDFSFDYSEGQKKYDESVFKGVGLRWAHRKIIELSRDSSSVMEVGCFTGFFVKELGNVCQLAFGIDVNQAALRFGQETLGLKGRISTQFALSEIGLDYVGDLVLVDCLEHIETPDSFIADLIHSYQPNRVIIAGPLKSRAMIDRSDFPPHHLWRFSELSIDKMMKDRGFSIAARYYEYDVIALARNLVGKMLYRRQNENWGAQVSFENKTLNQALTVVSGIFKLPSSLILRLFGTHYASSVLVYSKSALGPC